ncbi:MAG: PAS domain S-box protein [Haloarculaceae archaeon]
MNGVALLSRIREQSPALPFILYTDSGSEQVASEAISAGVNEYVTKSDGEPDHETLVPHILSLVESQHGPQQSSKQVQISQLVRDVQSELVRATTQAEIDAAVCEALAGADPFIFAWIGDYTAGDDQVRPRRAAGIGLDYLENIEIPFDEDAAERGPTARAIETRSMQVMQNIPEDPGYEPWRDAALERGYRSSAAVPLTYDDTFYGVLNIYADRCQAFGAGEQELLQELGQTVAHTYHRVDLQEKHEQQYRELFEEAPVMFVLTRSSDGTPVIEDCNAQFAEKIGFTRTELIDRPLTEVYTEPSTGALLEEGGYNRALAGNFVKEERELLTADGTTLSTLMRASPRRNTEGEIVGTLALYVDITARERAQNVIQQGRAMESSMDGMAILDTDHEHVYANQAYADIYGYDTAAAFEGEGWQTCYEETERERFADEILPSLETNGQWRGEATGVRQDGTMFPQELSLTRVDEGSLIAVVRDVTARKQRETELRESRKRLRVLFDESPDAITVHDGEGELIEVNAQLVDNLGYSREQLRSMNITDIEAGFSREELLNSWDEMVVGDRKKVEGTYRRKDASTFPVEVWLSKIELNGKERYIALSRDISERKERQQELARTNTVLSTLLENLPVGMLTEDDNREILAANQALCDVFDTSLSCANLVGRDCEEINQQISELFEDSDAFVERTEELLQRRELVLDEELQLADGRTLARSFVPYQLPTGGGNLWLYRDITDRKARERELERQEFLFNRAQDIADIGVWEYDPSSEELMWSDGVRRIHAVDETYDPTIEEAIDFYHPDDRETIRTAVEQAIEDGESYDIDLKLVRADGKKRDVRSRGEVITDENDDTELVRGIFQDITERKERERALERYERLVENLPIGVYQTTPGPNGEFTLVNNAMVDIFDAESKDDLRNRTVDELYVDPGDRKRFSDMLLEQGVVQSEELELETLSGEQLWGEVTAISREVDGNTVYDGAVQNITARKAYEQQLETQRDDLDLLNQVVRHDIRNDLQVVLAYGDLLTDHIDEEGQEFLEKVLDSSKNAVELTKTARDMADVMLSTDAKQHPVRLRHALEGELSEIRSAYAEALITVDGGIPDVTVCADDMLDSLFRNVLKNAIQHNDKATPTVNISVMERDGTAVVSIADNGPGVPDDLKDEIFDKGEKGLESEGTGIGLYLVQTLVDSYGGDVWVEDRAGAADNADSPRQSDDNDPEGAVFVVELPIAE